MQINTLYKSSAARTWKDIADSVERAVHKACQVDEYLSVIAPATGGSERPLTRQSLDIAFFSPGKESSIDVPSVRDVVDRLPSLPDNRPSGTPVPVVEQDQFWAEVLGELNAVWG